MHYISYQDIIGNINGFRRVDRFESNRYDNPASLYFRPVFYFTEENGLLGTAGMDLSNTSIVNSEFDNFSDIDSTNVAENDVLNNAFYYLVMNDELERAVQLKRFITLLSEISQNSPWYFKEISGVDAALEHKMFDKDFKIEEERKQLTITCLEDSYDQRIGTLLDLYRNICYSYQLKKEILPANLRKFNMGIFIFEVPMFGRGGFAGHEDASVTIPKYSTDSYIGNTKYIEFRNCEIDQNSGKTAWGTLTNEEPMSPKYTITISYDDAYEERYNNIMQGVITDFIEMDTYGFRNDVLAENEINSYGLSGEFESILANLSNTEISKRYLTSTGNGNFQSLPLYYGDENADSSNVNVYHGKEGDKDVYQYSVQETKPNMPADNLENNPQGMVLQENEFPSSLSTDRNYVVKEEQKGLSNRNINSSNLTTKEQEINAAKEFQQAQEASSISKSNIGAKVLSEVKSIMPGTELAQIGGILNKEKLVNAPKNIAYGTISAAKNAAKNAIKKELKKIYIGNINGISISGAIDTANRLLSGDVTGFISDITNSKSPLHSLKSINGEPPIEPVKIDKSEKIYENPKPELEVSQAKKANLEINVGTFNPELAKTKLPQYDYDPVIAAKLSQTNIGKSLYNNL